MRVTVFGISTEVNPLQVNAPLLILVTPFGIEILAKSLQPQKARSPIIIMSWGIIVLAQPITKVLLDERITALQSFRES